MGGVNGPNSMVHNELSHLVGSGAVVDSKPSGPTRRAVADI